MDTALSDLVESAVEETHKFEWDLISEKSLLESVGFDVGGGTDREIKSDEKPNPPRVGGCKCCVTSTGLRILRNGAPEYGRKVRFLEQGISRDIS